MNFDKLTRGSVLVPLPGTGARGRIETGAGKGNFYCRSETGYESWVRALQTLTQRFGEAKEIC